jgi:hypothetical protein
VRYATISRMLATLAGGHADHTWATPPCRTRPPRPAHPLDGFAMRELTATQADDLYELVAERT